ncbi:MAG: hypothetical protein IKF14_15495 [Atopobiaceae bacterium]|nr:hypothetical protein [Atopobiaceae bacterium]
MHSLLATILFTIASWLAFPLIALPFTIGMALNILLDLTNKVGVQILYPLSCGPCFKWFDSEGWADKVIRYVALSATIILAVWRVAGGVVGSPGLATTVTEAQQHTSLLGLSSFQVYVIAINVFSFLFLCYDY